MEIRKKSEFSPYLIKTFLQSYDIFTEEELLNWNKIITKKPEYKKVSLRSVYKTKNKVKTASRIFIGGLATIIEQVINGSVFYFPYTKKGTCIQVRSLSNKEIKWFIENGYPMRNNLEKSGYKVPQIVMFNDLDANKKSYVAHLPPKLRKLLYDSAEKRLIQYDIIRRSKDKEEIKTQKKLLYKIGFTFSDIADVIYEKNKMITKRSIDIIFEIGFKTMLHEMNNLENFNFRSGKDGMLLFFIPYNYYKYFRENRYKAKQRLVRRKNRKHGYTDKYVKKYVRKGNVVRYLRFERSTRNI